MKSKLITYTLLLFTYIGIAQNETSIQSTFIGSHGYFLESANKKVAVDAHIYWTDYNYGYIGPTYEIKNNIENANEPFDKLDLVLISHNHSDHYNTEVIENSMALNPNAIIVTNPEVYNILATEANNFSSFKERVYAPQIEHYNSIDTTINEIELSITCVDHFDIDLYMYSFVMEGVRITHLNGWNPLDTISIDTVGVTRNKADIALLSYDHLLDENKLSLFKKHINPKFSTVGHIDGATESRINAIHTKVAELKNEYPMNCFTVPMEQLIFSQVSQTLIVDTLNMAPEILVEIADTIIKTNEAFNLQVNTDNYADKEMDNIVFDVKQSNGSDLPDWLSFDATSLTLSGTASEKSNNIFELYVTDEKGARSVDKFRIKVDEEVNVNTQIDKQLKISYNTNTKALTFQNINLNSNYQYTICDITGKNIHKGTIDASTIYVKEISSGIYIINVSSQNTFKSSKFWVK